MTGYPLFAGLTYEVLVRDVTYRIQNGPWFPTLPYVSSV